MTGRVAGSETFRAQTDRVRPNGVARREFVRQICSAVLLIGGGVHLAVGLQHAGSNFGALSLVAGIAQEALGVLVFLRAADAVLRAVVILNGMLIQLYALNVTVGLPPMMSHSQIGGNHEVWLFTLGWPGVVDAQGVLAITTEIVAIACAMWLAGRHDSARS